MTTQQALDWFNKAKLQSWTIRDLEFNRDCWESRCVARIATAGEMVHKMGGELISRQTIAAIIACTPL